MAKALLKDWHKDSPYLSIVPGMIEQEDPESSFMDFSPSEVLKGIAMVLLSSTAPSRLVNERYKACVEIIRQYSGIYP